MRLTALVPLLWLAGAIGLLAAVGWARDTSDGGNAGGKPRAVAVSDGPVAVSTKQPAKRKLWTGKQGVRYERSYRICSVFTVKEVAGELGVAARRKPAARAHANAWYEPHFRQAAYRGCLDAFRGRPPALG
jgi:hypothetical protein